MDKQSHDGNRRPEFIDLLIPWRRRQVGDSWQELLAPSVITDKLDYRPGETAMITASGFRPGETITFTIADDPQDPGDDGDADLYQPFSVTDGGAGDLDGIANGQVVTTWFVPTDDDGSGSGTPDALNASLILTALGSAAITPAGGSLAGINASATNTTSWMIDNGLIKSLAGSLIDGKLWYSTDSDLAYESSIDIDDGKILQSNGEFITGGGYGGNDSNALNVNFNLRIAEDVSGATGSSQQVQLENIYWKNNAGKPVGAPDLAANYFSANDVVITGNKTLPMPARDIIRLPDLTICKEISRTTDPLDFVSAEEGEYQFYLYLDNPTIGTLAELDAADVRYTDSPYLVGADGCITITNLDATFNNADPNYDYLIDGLATWFITEEQVTGAAPYAYHGYGIVLFNGAEEGDSVPPDYISVNLAGQSGTDAQSAVVTWRNVPATLEVTLNGRKIHDLDANGVLDDGEQDLDGWIINLFSDESGLNVGTATTSGGGDWTIKLDLPNGYYTISEVLNPGHPSMGNTSCWLKGVLLSLSLLISMAMMG